MKPIHLNLSPTLLHSLGLGVISTLIHFILSVKAHTEDDVAQYRLKSNSIVPILIPTMPKHKLSIIYKHAKVDFGNKLNGFQMMDQPVQVSYPASKGFYYTIFMLGHDSPCKEQPMDDSWLHWLVGNVPGNDFERGESIADYCGSLAGYEAGLHRLIYVVYEQPNKKKIKFEEEHLDEDAEYGKRTQFNLINFTKKYDLEEPFAANFGVLDLSMPQPGM